MLSRIRRSEDVLVRREIFDGLAESISKLLAGRSRNELVERGQALGLPCSILNTPAEFVDDEQLAARDYFVTLRGADGGDVRMPGRSPSDPHLRCSRWRSSSCLGELQLRHRLLFGERGDASGPVRPLAPTAPTSAASISFGVLTFGVPIAGNTTGLILAEPLGWTSSRSRRSPGRKCSGVLRYGFQRDVLVHEPSGIPNTVSVRRAVAQHANVSPFEMNTEVGLGASPASRRRR